MNRRAVFPGERGELGVVANEGVESAPDIHAILQRAANHRPPIVRQAAALRRNADQQGRRLVCHSLFERGDDRNALTEPEDVGHGTAGLRGIEHRGDLFRRVPDA